jgi:hypothetical protein
VTSKLLPGLSYLSPLQGKDEPGRLQGGRGARGGVVDAAGGVDGLAEQRACQAGDRTVTPPRPRGEAIYAFHAP